MRNTAAEGRWVYGHPPFGYTVKHAIPGRAGRLVVVPEDAEVVRLVWAIYEDGNGDKGTAAILTLRGVPAPYRPDLPRKRAPGTWTPKHVSQIITSPVYAGRLTYKGTVVCEAAHEAIIDPVRFDRVQALRRTRHRTQRKTNPIRLGERGLFTPWLRCGLCGGPVKVSHSRPDVGPWRYICATRAYNRAVCDGMSGRVDEVDPLALDALWERVTDEALLDHAARWQAWLAGQGQQQIEDHRYAIQARIAEADAAIKRAVGMVSDGLVEKADIAEQVQRHGAARDTARDELALLPAPAPVPLVTPEDAAGLRAKVMAAFEDKPVQVRRKALDRVLDSAELHPERLLIRFRPRWEGSGHTHHDPYGPP